MLIATWSRDGVLLLQDPVHRAREYAHTHIYICICCAWHIHLHLYLLWVDTHTFISISVAVTTDVSCGLWVHTYISNSKPTLQGSFWLSPFVHLTLFSNSEKPCPCCPSYSHLFDPSLHVTNLLSPSPSPGPSILLRLQPATLGFTLTAPHPSCLWTLLIPRPDHPVHVDAFLTSLVLWHPMLRCPAQMASSPCWVSDTLCWATLTWVHLFYHTWTLTPLYTDTLFILFPCLLNFS